jgi:hypothetical protein
VVVKNQLLAMAKISNFLSLRLRARWSAVRASSRSTSVLLAQALCAWLASSNADKQ